MGAGQGRAGQGVRGGMKASDGGEAAGQMQQGRGRASPVPLRCPWPSHPCKNAIDGGSGTAAVLPGKGPQLSLMAANIHATQHLLSSPAGHPEGPPPVACTPQTHRTAGQLAGTPEAPAGGARGEGRP